MATSTKPTAERVLGPADSDTLRRLADLHTDGVRVVSAYLDLDPSRFATPPARESAIHSLLDDAGRQLDARDDLSHSEQQDLRGDLGRIRDYLEGGQLSADGARALALFCSSGADLFEAVKLTRPVESRVVFDSSPYVEPLVLARDPWVWCVALVNRERLRVLRGSRDRLEEAGKRNDPVHGQHKQGGWSQARYQRSIEKDVAEHLARSTDALTRGWRRDPFDRLLIGGPDELLGYFEEDLPDELRRRLAGRIDVDVENTNADEVLAAAQPAIEAEERRAEREALDRMIEGAATGGRGATGLDDVLAALSERRVETLLFEERFEASGVVCPSCGWLGPPGPSSCPADGSALEQRDGDMLELAVEAAIDQSAQALVVRHHPDLGPVGRIGAVLRF